MRVLVVGAGAVGGYFGGRLLEAGGDVTFLVRPSRQAKIAERGLVIRSSLGDATLKAPTILTSEIRQSWDLIIVACKAYDLADAMDSLAPAVGPETAILPLLNGMAHLDILDHRFGAARVVGGWCAIASTLDADGAIRHLNQAQVIGFGERSGPTARIAAIADLFARTKLDWHQSDIILGEMWEKWVFLAALAASTCLMRASVGDIVSAGGQDLLAGALAETVSVAQAAGSPPRAEVLDQHRTILSTAGSTLTASMLRDIEKGGRTEADHVIGDMLSRGTASGCALPTLRMAYLHLKCFEPGGDASQRSSNRAHTCRPTCWVGNP